VRKASDKAGLFGDEEGDQELTTCYLRCCTSCGGRRKEQLKSRGPTAFWAIITQSLIFELQFPSRFTDRRVRVWEIMAQRNLTSVHVGTEA
jgi:hypothetical protein